MIGHSRFGSMHHRQVLLLATAQALFQTTSVLVMTVGGLACSLVAPSASPARWPPRHRHCCGWVTAGAGPTPWHSPTEP
jgi:hypothetical protein